MDNRQQTPIIPDGGDSARQMIEVETGIRIITTHMHGNNHENKQVKNEQLFLFNKAYKQNLKSVISKEKTTYISINNVNAKKNN